MDFFYDPSIFSDDIINKLTQLDIIDEMLDYTSLETIQKSIESVNIWRHHILDVDILVEVFIHGDDRLAVEIHRIILDI